MGWLARKKGEDVIDLSQMQKRGQLPEQRMPVSKPTIDLSAQNSPGDFLSSLSRVGATNHVSSPQSERREYGGAVSAQLRAARSGGFAEVNELKIKLDDSNYKIERLEKRVRELEEVIRRMGGR